MCGRYTQTASLKTLKERFDFTTGPMELKPRYNIAPSQDCPVIVIEGGRSLRMLHWGLIPAWAKDPAIGHKLINARAETLLEKSSFKKPFQEHRCLVLADGFYEWRKDGTAKTPMRITLESTEPFAMAGLWDIWKGPSGKEIRSFTIVTTSANDALRPIHDRMPAILDRKSEEEWLDPEAETSRLVRLLKPCGAELSARAVSNLVNSPANDRPECLVPR